MAQDEVTQDASDNNRDDALDLEIHFEPGEATSPSPTTSESPNTVNLLDPILCAELHNKIIQKILELQPSWRPHVKRNLFKVPPQRFLLEQGSYTDNTSLPREPVPEQEFRERLGGNLSTFLESIDIISIEKEHLLNGIQQKTYDTPFLAFFDSPDPGLFYDFAEMPSLEDHPYVIQLYPTSYIFACEAQAGGIMLDLITGLAMFARPFDSVLPKRNSWVPLDIVLCEWLKMIDDGKVYWGNGELDEKKWTEKGLQRALEGWNEYLKVLEEMVEQLNPDYQQDAAKRMVDDEILEKWAETMHPMATLFLKQARRPAICIERVGPGITYFDSSSFDAIHEARRIADLAAYDDPEKMEEMSFRLNMTRGGWLTTLIFPAFGPHSVAQTTSSPSYGNAIHTCELLNRTLGLHIVGDSDHSAIIDHDGKTQIFQHRDHCPWGSIWDFPLADMFRAWKIMLETGLWKVGSNGVEGDYSWFADHRNLEWIPNTRWNPDLLDAEGNEIGELKNDWVEWNDLEQPTEFKEE